MQYVVQAGDTLMSIAQRFNTTADAIARANNISNVNIIHVGQILIIPGTSSPAPTPPMQPAPPTPSPLPGGDCPLLRRGDSGASIRRLQTLLRNRGVYSGPIDGFFGSTTEASVRRWQARSNIPVTGTSTIQTWRSLGVDCSVTPGPGPIPPPPPAPDRPDQCYCPVLRIGSAGPSVRFLQRELQSRGYYNGSVNGRFDTRTEQSVRRFQRDEGLSVTGVVNRATWEALGHHCCDAPSPSPGTPTDTKTARGLRHVLQANKAVYRRGEDVRLTLSKTNITNDEVTLRYPTNQIIEITVRNESGRVVWRYSEHRRFGQGSRVIVIFEGGTQNIFEVWNQTNDSGRQVPAGTYRITVENLATRASLTVPVTIR